MVGLIQILIYLACIHLVYKAVEIFQLAYVSDTKTRYNGIVFGILAIIISLLVSVGALGTMENIAAGVGNKLMP